MTTELPRAFISHRMQGRVRVRIPEMRHQAEFFSKVRERLSQLSSVHRIATNPATGSVLIEHGNELGDLAELGREHELFQLVPKDPGPTLSERLFDLTSVPDALVKNVTGGTVDIAGVTVLTLAGLGIRQFVAGHPLPAGWTLIKDAIYLARDARKK